MTLASTGNLSFLDVVGLCDNVHLVRDSTGLSDATYNSEILIPLYLTDKLDSPAIGLLRPQMVEQLLLENQKSREKGDREAWKFRLDTADFIMTRNGSLVPSASFSDWLDTPTKRNTSLKDLCEGWRDSGLFLDVCGPKKWRNELYPIYADPFGPHDHPSHGGSEEELNFVFELERSACALFGLVTYGVHMNIFEEVASVDGQSTLRVWVPRRALTKPTFPGMLDNTVAGGIPSGMSIFESLVKECLEEASLEDSLVRAHTRAVGSISYFYRSAKGWLQPEIEYIYDIRIPLGADPASFTPRPMDGEVESFELVSHAQMLHQLRSGLFKPNCGLVIIDLLIRLGYITPDNEPNFMKIINRLHGNFDYDKW